MSLLHSGSTASDSKLYVEDVFSTYLYTGNGSTKTITNGIDLAGKGGLVWSKGRNLAGYNNCLMDTARSGILFSDTTQSANDYPTDIQSYNANGFTLKSSSSYSNIVGTNYASWTFRKAPKFFDVVTYTGNGVAGRLVPHSLNCEVGFAVVKRIDTGTNWEAQHRSIDLSGNKGLYLNLTDALATHNNVWNSTHATATDLVLGSHSDVNGVGGTYVAYLFAHNAGGFGDDGEQNVISCGSFSYSGSEVDINLGFEPQFFLYKASNVSNDWEILDVMRAWNETGYCRLNPHKSAEEACYSHSSTSFIKPYANGVKFKTGGSGRDYIYIAIRRGPMKTPESGTGVFAVGQGDGTTTNPQFRSGFVTDFALFRNILAGNNWETTSRLQGSVYMRTNLTSAEAADADIDWDFMNGFYSPVRNTSFYSWMFRRAPGFFDVVCYTGTGGYYPRAIAHNLTVVPELIIVKQRNSTGNWVAASTKLLNPNYPTAPWVNNLYLNTSAAIDLSGWFDGLTASNFSTYLNTSGATYVAYLFATCPGVSKVGSYSGNGTSQTINCGFSTGARFILVKRTDDVGDWYVWDTTRGIVAANDPHLSLNSIAAEVTTDDSIDPAVEGFVCNQNTTTNINVSGGTYIYLAIA